MIIENNFTSFQSLKDRAAINFSDHKDSILSKAIISSVCLIAFGALFSNPMSVGIGIVLGTLSVVVAYCAGSSIKMLLQPKNIAPGPTFFQKAIIHVKTYQHLYCMLTVAAAVIGWGLDVQKYYEEAIQRIRMVCSPELVDLLQEEIANHLPRALTMLGIGLGMGFFSVKIIRAFKE